MQQCARDARKADQFDALADEATKVRQQRDECAGMATARGDQLRRAEQRVHDLETALALAIAQREESRASVLKQAMLVIFAAAWSGSGVAATWCAVDGCELETTLTLAGVSVASLAIEIALWIW